MEFNSDSKRKDYTSSSINIFYLGRQLGNKKKILFLSFFFLLSNTAAHHLGCHIICYWSGFKNCFSLKWTHEKMLIIHHQGNANQNYNEISSHICQMAEIKKKKPWGWCEELLCPVGGNANWLATVETFGSFSKN